VPPKERPHTFSPLITPNPLNGTVSDALLEVRVRVFPSPIALPPPLTSNLHGTWPVARANTRNVSRLQSPLHWELLHVGKAAITCCVCVSSSHFLVRDRQPSSKHEPTVLCLALQSAGMTLAWRVRCLSASCKRQSRNHSISPLLTTTFLDPSLFHVGDTNTSSWEQTLVPYSTCKQ
jgi:hypothetical protein